MQVYVWSVEVMDLVSLLTTFCLNPQHDAEEHEVELHPLIRDNDWSRYGTVRGWGPGLGHRLRVGARVRAQSEGGGQG